MPEQLSFDLPVTVSQGAEDFFVAPPNQTAYAMVTGGGWPDGKLALIGPKGSGKSHLLRVWQQQSRAQIIDAATLDPTADLPAAGAAIGIDNAETLHQSAEEYLFHLHNHLRATGGQLLVTGATPPIRWPVQLPDLASRLQAATLAQIEDPDDDLLRAVMLKQFADRQIAPPPEVIAYLIPRIERSFAAAAQIVEALDTTAMARNSAISRTLARSLLAQDPPD